MCLSPLPLSLRSIFLKKVTTELSLEMADKAPQHRSPVSPPKWAVAHAPSWWDGSDRRPLLLNWAFPWERLWGSALPRLTSELLRIKNKWAGGWRISLKVVAIGAFSLVWSKSREKNIFLLKVQICWLDWNREEWRHFSLMPSAPLGRASPLAELLSSQSSLLLTPR